MDNILKYEYLVNSYASKFSKYYDFADLKQVGMIGLINAVKNYKENSNTKFSTYAFLWIKGEILKYIREDKNIKVSKDYISLNRKIEEVKELLRQKLQREPNIEEIALFLNIDQSIISDVIQSCEFVKSLDYIINDDENEASLYDMTSYIEKGYNEDFLDLKNAINKLDSKEKQLIEYRYFDGMTQSETSKKLGVNQVKVSRDENKILKKLKMQLV